MTDYNIVDRGFFALGNKLTPIEAAYSKRVPKPIRFVAYPFWLVAGSALALVGITASISVECVTFMLDYFKTKYKLFR